jgi:hypothetical protein
MPNPATANMALIMPTEGGDAGEWDAYINDAADLIDAHDHSTGKGVKVKTNGLDINADLTFASGGSYSAITNVKAVDFQPHAASAMTAYAGCLFTNSSDSNNLYFRTQAGSNVRITNGATLDTTTSGGIGGDYASIPAEVAYIDASDTYTFRQTAAGNWARLQCGPVRIAELGTTESVYIELAAPAALGASYTITPATALPGSTSVVQISSTGALTYSNTLSHGNRTRVISGPDFETISGTPTKTSQGRFTSMGTTLLAAPLGLNAGDRVRSITFTYNRGGAGDIDFTLTRNTGDGAGANDVTVSTTNVAAGTGWTTVTLSSIDHTVLAAWQYVVVVDTNNAAHAFAFAEVTWDKP